jgi:hypothetical protein
VIRDLDSEKVVLLNLLMDNANIAAVCILNHSGISAKLPGNDEPGISLELS